MEKYSRDWIRNKHPLSRSSTPPVTDNSFSFQVVKKPVKKRVYTEEQADSHRKSSREWWQRQSKDPVFKAIQRERSAVSVDH